MTPSPKLALCNFFDNSTLLRQFALSHGFDGVDWTFSPANLPRTRMEERTLVKTISSLHPLEVRYHCFFTNTDLGDLNVEKAKDATRLFRHLCRLVSRLGGSRITVHVGLGRNSSSGLSWQRTIEGLADLTHLAGDLGLRLCVENLARGWTSRPDLFEKFLRKTGCWATLDIGHARGSAVVRSRSNRVEDFVLPHPERFLNAHVYHEETMDGHLPPATLTDIEDRLRLLRRLPFCDWWVLELREERALLQTLNMVREFLCSEPLSADIRGAANQLCIS